MPASFQTERSTALKCSTSLKRLQLFMAVIVYRILVDYSYVTWLVPINSVTDRLTNDFVLGKYLESWAIMLFCALFLPTETKKPSDFLIFAFFFMPFLAQIDLYAFLDGSRVYAYATWAGFIIMAASRNLAVGMPTIEVKNGHLIAPAFSAVLVIGMAVVYYVMIGLNTFELDLLKVYDNRQEINATIGSSALLGYVGTWVYKVFNVFLIAWALYRRKYLWVAALYALQIYFFGITSQKAVLIYPVLVFISYTVAQPRRPTAIFTWLLAAFVIIGIIEEITTQTNFWDQFVVRRQIWMPARINWVYYEFFSTHGFVYMSDSVFKALVSYPFQVPPPNMIGIYMLNNVNMHADTGFLGTSYMHFGVAGMLLFSLAAGLLMLLTDMLTIGRVPIWYGLSITIGPFFNLFNDADLSTTLATHGLLVSFLLLFMVGQPRDKAAEV